jgi:hypothetical protein
MSFAISELSIVEIPAYSWNASKIALTGNIGPRGTRLMIMTASITNKISLSMKLGEKQTPVSSKSRTGMLMMTMRWLMTESQSIISSG